MKFAVAALLGAVSAASSFDDAVSLAKYRVKQIPECNEQLEGLSKNLFSEVNKLVPLFDKSPAAANAVIQLNEWFEFYDAACIYNEATKILNCDDSKKAIVAKELKDVFNANKICGKTCDPLTKAEIAFLSRMGECMELIPASMIRLTISEIGQKELNSDFAKL